ncbi:hypothetical protein [Pectobacterium atrosepticum]|uniref:hypothetical protein n=1 Tax=Pectobacterium atrosepticum TaxID=29471 RepID=UPI001BFC3E34|nr:hypothetical protein [Pectobacterium atrosepticum]QWC52416.1 hypothetical protein HLB43_17605 [Pectobacterium atrosepticum]
MIICNFLEFTSLTFNYINKVVHQPDNYGSIVSAIIVAFILFFIKEFFRIPPKLSGVFYLKSTTTESSYNPYKNIIIYYTLIIYSDGSIIEGTSEKQQRQPLSREIGCILENSEVEEK